MIVSNFSIKRYMAVLVLILMICVIGYDSYVKLPRESAPDINVPVIMVSTFYEGAAPEDIEYLITRPIERKLKSISDIKELRSDSAESFSSINIEFDPSVDIDNALQKVREKVDQAKPDLPPDLDDDPKVIEFSFNAIFPVMYVVIAGDVGLVRLKEIAEDMEDDLESIKGVLDAEVIGGLEREIRVEFDPDRLVRYQLSMGEILGAIANNNLNTPSGSIDVGDAKFNLKVPGEFSTPDEINRIVIGTRSGSGSFNSLPWIRDPFMSRPTRNSKAIYLTDIAWIRDTFKDRDSYARLNGQESVTIKVTKRTGENLLRIAEECKEVGARYQERNPTGVHITYTSDSSRQIHMMVSNLENNILSGLILVLVVIFVSLGVRNAVLVSLAIPLSMLMTFGVLRALGITLNMVVLFSLVLALGMLVDNAIVIVENIYRHHSQGKPLVQSAMDATAEVAWPVITSTATTVAAFFPLVFWPGIMGQFMSYLPMTVIITLVASLFVALVINPTLGALFIRVSRKDREKAKARAAAEPAADGLPPEPRYGLVLRAYRWILRVMLAGRVPVLPFLAVVLFYGLLAVMIYLHFGVFQLGVEFFPDTEPSRILVELKAPEGTRVLKTNLLARQAEQVVNKYGNIEFVTTAVGAGSGVGTGANRARIAIDMVDREFRKGPITEEERAAGREDDGKIYFANSNDTMQALREELASTIVGADVKVDKEEEGPPTGPPVNVEIAGDDYDVLARIARELKECIKDVPGLVDLEDDYVRGLPEFRVEVDKERAALMNLDTRMIGQMIKASINGLKVGDYRENEEEYDIIARLPLDMRTSVTDVMRVRIPDQNGVQVPLSSVARVVTTSGLGTIKHIDEKRVVSVSANVDKQAGHQAPVVLANVRKIASKMKLPAGYAFSYTGENEEQEETEAFLTSAFMIALFLIAMVLVTQFNSVTTPFIILNSIVLSLLGVFIGLIVIGTPFGIIMTGMGVISLAGVVVNNAIVLIDYIELLRRQGLDLKEAILRAGCTRFRPVVLTAVTTILGLAPMAIGVSYDFRGLKWVIGDESSQWWGAMASAVIFGLAVATLLTLFVVPTLYYLIDIVKGWFATLWAWWCGLWPVEDDDELAPDVATASEPASGK